MPPPEAALQHYQHMQRVQLVALTASRAAWRQMQSDYDGTWPEVLEQLVRVVTAAQTAGARSGAAMVPQALAALGVDLAAAGEVAIDAAVGVASDGRPLPSLLQGAVVATKQAIRAGAPAPVALDSGERWLQRVVRTQTTDAARTAASVAVAVRRGAGWTRAANPPCCRDCLILAGRFYRWSAGFDRHPGCDCYHVPATEDVAGAAETSPLRLFEAMTTAQQDQAFTIPGAQAIRDGADPAQVVNARRSMAPAQVFGEDVLITLEGITRRGLAYQALRERRENPLPDVRRPGQRYFSTQVPRVMPETIYRIATDRDDAIRLLRLNGFIT